MQVETREFTAQARFQRVSPQKARLVLELIKGRSVEEALNTVAFTKKSVAPLVEKVLRSALQNANYLSQEQGLDVDVDNLYVKTAIANEGPRMKRIRPAPMGRAYPLSAAHVAHRDLGGRAQARGPGADGGRGARSNGAVEGEEGRRQEGSGKEGGREEDGSQEIGSQEEGCEVG